MNKQQLTDKLRNEATKRNVDFNTLRRLYMYDRFIERLSLSKYNNNFVLKGGFYLSALYGIESRSTMDIDTAFRNANFDKDTITEMINSIISIHINDDAIVKLVKIDEESHLETIVDGSENIYNLTLKSVIANGNNNSNFSDRLVFETDSDIELKEFNKADLQIRWHSNLTSEVLKAQLLKDNDCVGRIKTLSLTFDEKLNNI